METGIWRGYIEKIFEPNDYDQEIIVSNYRSDDEKFSMYEKFKHDSKNNEFPNAFTFKANVKNVVPTLPNAGIGDLVEVRYVLLGKTGISKKNGKYFHFNELRILKNDGMKIIEKALNPPPSEEQDGEEGDVEDIPF